MFINQSFVCSNSGDLCSQFSLICVNLGVAGAPGVGVFPFSLYSNLLSETGELDNPKDDL